MSSRASNGPWAYVALGSNQGDSRAILQQAMDRLEALSAEALLRSSLWETKPVDCPPGSPNFLNAVVVLRPRSGETPESLLASLQALEREFGRRPKQVHNEPRSLDLDLIAFGAETRHASGLTLPHPWAHERLFVLQPLSEVAPDLVLPGQHLNVMQLLVELSSRAALAGQAGGVTTRLA
jgi:2-amino-4-hydroxy-6-hydroxymethyldihydropteridine diphosphokinase